MTKRIWEGGKLSFSGYFWEILEDLYYHCYLTFINIYQEIVFVYFLT